MLLLTLFSTFFKIGMFSFGGGYAMIPLIQEEIIKRHGFLTTEQFGDIIAIAEMTPGPIAVNSATFVGYNVSGVAGALVSTVGVVMPSFIIILILARFFVQYQHHSITESLFRGIRPMVVALIISAGVFIGSMALVDMKSVIIWIAVFAAINKAGVHPIAAIMSAGLLGILLF